MTIAEIIEKLSQERTFGSRFPARIIFVEDLTAYSDLVSSLKSACDVTINIATFGKGDVAPRFDKLKEHLTTYFGQQVLLLSVGEYLRMCIKRELDNERSQFPAFWEAMQPEASRTRYIMPVFCCKDYFDRIVGHVDERQESYIWTLDSMAGVKKYSISVYSPQFIGVISADANDLESWLNDWQIILGTDRPCTLITKQHKNIESSYGTINIKTIDNPFSYLLDLLQDADVLQREWAEDSFWADLIPYAKKGNTFKDVVFNILKITTFDFVSIAARWDILSDLSRKLVWLWYRIYPTDEYYSYACKKARSSSEIPSRIRDEILAITTRSQSWIDERMSAMKALSFRSFDDTYFKQMDKLPLADTKLRLLTYQTHEERAYAIKVISGLLRDGAESDALAELIRKDYPTLATYLSGNTGLDLDIDKYLTWYRKNKLINRFPGDYPVELSFEKFDTRFKQLHKLSGKDCFTFWIDGFGVEWLPVFLQELQTKGINVELKSITSAMLPTETEYNHQWDENDPQTDKWGRLDSFSHRGTPDDKSYFSCIVNQLSVFSEAAKKVENLLSQHEYVAITGDHGSSRLAALAFHDASIIPIMAPAHATVRSFGRFCELADDGENFIPLPGMTKSKLNGKTYVLMNNYQHFAVSGNAAGGNTDEQDVIGEIHGGNTPEERLVPVVVVKRKQPLSPMTCQPSSPFVTKENGHIETTLKFSRSALSVEVSSENLQALCAANPDGTWHITFEEVPESDKLTLSVVANGRMLAEKIVLKIKGHGIIKNDGLGGLP